ncbi:DUF5060 domain-containing protein [Streptomyces pathocidini]|uniref:DUF5060 domain-containing protein n=1 Tax=Streptomyces pathocidini TaxID=1650571 RepID=UPI0033E123AC
MTVEQWDVCELRLEGPADGNPYTDVRLGARFQYRNRVVDVDGFYDGDGVYRVRFMPDRPGLWRYVTRSDCPALDGWRGTFECTPARPGNNGPVRAAGSAFRYADGTRYLPVGTTCYHWTHDLDEDLERHTLDALAASPFNKVRMCLLPTAEMAPPLIAFAGDTPGQLDKTRFNPAFFAHFERRLRDLLALGIQADVILFHPYDRGHWGVDDMTPEEDAFLLRYVLARLSAFRHVWWSVANEYDFNPAKSIEDWGRLGRFVQRHDPYQHLRSIHNGTKMYTYERIYDFSKPWTTHQSIQHWDASLTGRWLAACGKPVVIDEIGYEGKVGRRWGNVTGRTLVRQFWHGFAAGGSVGHGECYPAQDPDGAAWISIGGRLRGDSVERIAFLRGLLEEGPDDLAAARREGSYLLEYFGDHQHAYREVTLPPGADYRVDLIDTWNMAVTELDGVWRGSVRVELKGRPDMAVRIRRAG